MFLRRLLGRYAVLTLASASVMMTAEAHPSGSALAPENLQSRATVCNGHAELCQQTFGNITFVGAHDSYAIGVNNLATNQDQSITQQLNDGIRMLQMQAHNQAGVIRLCHTSCSLFDGGTLQDYLTLVKKWMDANPTEVLSLLIVNIDNLPPANYASVFKAVGLDTMSYAPPSSPIPQSGWPTLGALIDAGTRLLTYLDNAADLTVVPYLMDEFSNIWETEFDVIDPSFNCNVNRTHSSDPTTQMFLINHFLDHLLLGQPVPFVDQLNVTNAASGPGSLGAQVDTCVAAHGRPPNFMLVDFYEHGAGSVFEVAARINGVPYTPATPIASPIPTSSSTSKSSSTTTGNGGSSVTVTSSSLNGGLSTISHSLTNQLFGILLVLTSVMTGTFVVI